MPHRPSIDRTIAVYITAGGRSSRFGSDKARALVGGEPMIVRIARQLAPVAASITAVADVAGKYDDLGIATIADRSPGLGPMSALQSAMHHCPADWFALVSCDVPGIRAEWIQSLMQHRTANDPAVAFRHEKWEPLLALYHVCLRDEVDRRIGGGELSLWRLLEASSAAAAPMPADWNSGSHASTPQDLRRYMGEP